LVGALEGRCGCDGWGFIAWNGGILWSSALVSVFERPGWSGIGACVCSEAWAAWRHIFGRAGRMGRKKGMGVGLMSGGVRSEGSRLVAIEFVGRWDVAGWVALQH